MSLSNEEKNAAYEKLTPQRKQLVDKVMENLEKGEHLLELTLGGTRGNTFGALHLTTPKTWKGPDMWYSGNNMWSYEYCLNDMGIMKKPELTLEK